MDEMMQQPRAGADMGAKIRQAAQQALTPQEAQIIQQTVTPQFVQVMSKLFGDQAVVLLGPLVNIAQGNAPVQGMSQQGMGGNALNAFTAQGPQVMGNMGNQQDEWGEGEGYGNAPCPGCDDPNCPDCNSMKQTPSSMRFGRRM